MRVFLTGATGFIGSRIIPELLAAGHQVLGLTRSDAGATQLRQAGAEPHHGTLEDPATLQRGAEISDAVIHCAFDHTFENFFANCEKDGRNLRALGAALKGSQRPLLITSGTGIGSFAPGELATEDAFNPDGPNPRKISEITGNALLEEGINVAVVRLPQVHDPYKQGLITPLVAIARQQGASAYVGEGTARYPAAHVLDVARLYVLALERTAAGAGTGARYHAVAEEGIPVRAIAEVLGRGLNLPVRSISPGEAPAHFGWMSHFADWDMPASSAKTQELLNWHPTGPTLLDDLNQLRFAEVQ